VQGITEVHCSDVEKWYKWKGSEKVEASYRELSIEERFLHGGPWMSVETCAIHLNYILASEQYPLVAELNGRIVGELELYVGEERGKLGKTAFIDIIVVHKNFRRRGIGKALINEARRIAIEEGCDTLSVWPEERAVPFYRKCGLREVAYNVVHFLIEVNEHLVRSHEHIVKPFPSNYKSLEQMLFISPRTASAFTTWLKSRWTLVLGTVKVKSDEGYVPELGLVFELEGIKQWKEAWLKLWTEDLDKLLKSLLWLCMRAGERGWKKLHLLIEEGIYGKYISEKLPGKIEGKEQVLMERLR